MSANEAFAFPCAVGNVEKEKYFWQNGMTLRDWFAGQALIGMLAYGDYGNNTSEGQSAASKAYRFADQMMRQRNAG